MNLFDVVHARLWLCFINNAEALHLLRNLISLLKPGAYLQWFEPLPLSAKAMHPMPELIDPAVDRVITHWNKLKPMSTSEWVERLPEAFRKEGLELVAVDRMPLPERYRHFWGHAQMAGLEHWAGDERSEALEQWLVQLDEAFANGTYLDTQFLCVVGRKCK